MRMDVKLGADLANFPAHHRSAFDAKANEILGAAIEEVKRVAESYAGITFTSALDPSHEADLTLRVGSILSRAGRGMVAVTPAERPLAERLVGHRLARPTDPDPFGRHDAIVVATPDEASAVLQTVKKQVR